MPLGRGSRIGPYEITAALGAGGMGEVYRARDPRLDRDVAIKALPDVFLLDAARVARFEREAKVLAALNHSNIAGILGVEDLPESGGARGPSRYLVLEFIEGSSLAELIARPSPFHLDDAIAIARQILDALEAAHEKGIVHRDLKPANIMVTGDGHVKVLDFGLARFVDGDTSGDATNSPTMTAMATQAGVILGTAAYMSPEQAKGRVADRRSDVWAFGCVLYEMLTGRRAFEGEDASETLAAVLTKTPDWTALPAGTPAGLRAVLTRCLERDRKKRIPEISTVRFLLDDAVAQPATEEARSVTIKRSGDSRRLWIVAALALAAGVAATLAVRWMIAGSTPIPSRQTARFEIVLPSTQLFGRLRVDRDVAVSPDGSVIVYVSSVQGPGTLVIRRLDRLDPEPLRGITEARLPFFSPRGDWIGFFQGNPADGVFLRKVPITGGPPTTLCKITFAPRGATWGPDNRIVFATSDLATGLLSIDAGGGEPKPLTSPNQPGTSLDDVEPLFLPDGRALLFVEQDGGADTSKHDIAVLDLATGARRTLVSDGLQPDFAQAADGTGYLLYATGGVLRARPFDPVRRQLLGDPIIVVENVAMARAAEYAVSRDGALVYVPGYVDSTGPKSLVWKDRNGTEEPIAAPSRNYTAVALSPDGTRLALDIRDQSGSGVWIWDLRGQTLTRLTPEGATGVAPVWIPDSQRVVFASTGLRHALFWTRADGVGAAEQLTDDGRLNNPSSVLPDGSRVLFTDVLSDQAGEDVFSLPLSGARQRVPVIQGPRNQRNAVVSPDGRWIAYESNESGTSQLYVRPFPNANTGRWLVADVRAAFPVWSASGSELFFVQVDRNNATLMAVTIEPGASFRHGPPQKLFDLPRPRGAAMPSSRLYDVSRDGKRFVTIKTPVAANGNQSAAGPDSSNLVVVLNMTEGLRRSAK